MIRLYVKKASGYVDVTPSDSPNPAVAMSIQPQRNENTGEVDRTVTTWEVTGRLIGSSISTQVSTLESNLSGTLLEVCLSTAASAAAVATGNIIAKLEPVSGQGTGGIFSSGVSYPDGSGTEWATKRRYSYSFTVEELKTVNSDGGWLEYTVSYQEDTRGVTSRSIEAVYHQSSITDIESNAEAAVVAIFAAGSYQRTIGTSKPVHTKKQNDFTCTVSITDTGLFKAMPFDGCAAASVSKNIRTVGNGRQIMTISGSFTDRTDATTGNDAEAAYEAVKTDNSAYRLLSEQKNVNEYTGELSFSLEYLYNSGSIIELRETITAQEEYLDYVMVPVLDGQKARRLDTVWRPARVTESGYKISKSRLSPPAPRWRRDVKTKSVTYETPEVTVSGTIAHYRVSWQYDYEFSSMPNIRGV